MGEVADDVDETVTPEDKDPRIDKLRQMFLDEFAENIEKGLYDDRDVSRVKCEDQYVRCFVEDRDKLEDSLAMMHESLKWRMEIGLNDLTEDNFNRWMWDLGAVFFHNTDKDGHKICECL